MDRHTVGPVREHIGTCLLRVHADISGRGASEHVACPQGAGTERSAQRLPRRVGWTNADAFSTP